MNESTDLIVLTYARRMEGTPLHILCTRMIDAIMEGGERLSKLLGRVAKHTADRVFVAFNADEK